MIFLDRIADECDSGTILLAMPPCAVRAHSAGKCLLYLGIGERLRPAIIPAKARECRQMLRQILLHIDAESVLAGDAPRMIRNVRRRLSCRGLDHLVTIDTHVRGVRVRKQANHSRFLGSNSLTPLEFVILGMGLPG